MEAQNAGTASAFLATETPVTTPTTALNAVHAKTASMHQGGTTLLASHVALGLLLSPHRRLSPSAAANVTQGGVFMSSEFLEISTQNKIGLFVPKMVE